MVGYRSIPQWLDSLLKEEFFEPCSIHAEKKEKNFYCFDCCSSVCQSCLFRHRKHIILQVRRYVYHDVLKLSDARNFMDCSGIQAYISNNAKVVFLKERPLNRHYKGSESSCFTCNRNLQDPFIFCCLSCKVKHIVATQGSLQLNLSNKTMMGFSDVDECQITPDSVLNSPSGSTANSDLQTALLCTATNEVVRKKRSNLAAQCGLNRVSTCSEPGDTHLNRRKRVPNRAPLC
ncbi:protein RGF1 INDUCIBLE TRANSCRIPTION FACTOR 1-like [Silene latifolia]|uniref:protein RGF1 INDUCIBLE TRANSCRIPTION FACTOR 1-like n=1 Tax=Silene latifolia TaxID=37657 RepID=UPI003D76A4A8